MNDPCKAQQWNQKLQELTTKKRQTERTTSEKIVAPSSRPSDLPKPSEIWSEVRDSQRSAKPGPR